MGILSSEPFSLNTQRSVSLSQAHSYPRQLSDASVQSSSTGLYQPGRNYGWEQTGWWSVQPVCKGQPSLLTVDNMLIGTIDNMHI